MLVYQRVLADISVIVEPKFIVQAVKNSPKLIIQAMMTWMFGRKASEKNAGVHGNNETFQDVSCWYHGLLGY